jgi:hypothetical protein
MNFRYEMFSLKNPVHRLVFNVTQSCILSFIVWLLSASQILLSVFTCALIYWCVVDFLIERLRLQKKCLTKDFFLWIRLIAVLPILITIPIVLTLRL